MTDYPIMRITSAVATIKAEPSRDAVSTSEGLFGELVDVISIHGDWHYIRMHRDGYEGFVYRHDIDSYHHDSAMATHTVHCRSTLLFTQPSLKAPVTTRLPFQSRLSLSDIGHTAFSKTHTGHFVWTEHTTPIGSTHPLYPVQLAQSHFLGAPYLWGGCSTDGLDCSGLIQALAISQGLPLPRDSIDQEKAIGTIVDYDNRQAADLVYWPGHTGILVDRHCLLHATAHSLSCQQEALDDVTARAGAISSIRRLF